MLFGYPLAATSENWLHECLCEILQLIHSCIETGKPVPLWPDIIPLTNIPESYRETMKRRNGLMKRLNTYHQKVKNLTTGKRRQILQILDNQNQIALLLSCQHNCEEISVLPQTVRKSITDLFTYAFDILTDLGVRDNQYRNIYEVIPAKVCPFCGNEPFDNPDSPRESFDHYLSNSKYSFAAANLRNLVPMGNKCNSRYKLAQDILRKDNGTRRKSFDPYNHKTVTISLDNSQPFAGTIGRTSEPLPKWEIDFSVSSEEVDTWDEIFHIRERYKRDILDEAFNNWLNGFRSWYRDPRKNIPDSDQKWIDAIEGYALYHESLGFEDRAFLKAAVFRMLHIHCKNGNQRLLNFIKNVVIDVII
jgi:hypothetical protein